MNGQRVVKMYQQRNAQASSLLFGYQNLAHVYRIQERHTATMRLLASAGYHPLACLHILDIGCGNGNMLRQFMQWGAMPEHLAGVDVCWSRTSYARRLSPHVDIRCASATDLAWPNGSFDLACQQTVFTSVLDESERRQIASEMSRVLRPGGAVLWYDFTCNNPHNPSVRGVAAHQIATLFPGFKISLNRITLAPPLARRIPERFLPVLYPLLSALSPLCTHYLGLLEKP